MIQVKSLRNQSRHVAAVQGFKKKMEHILKSLIEFVTRVKPLQPIIIAAGVIATFTFWQRDAIDNQQTMQQLLRDSYQNEMVCQEELQELRMRIYNLELKINELLKK